MYTEETMRSALRRWIGSLVLVLVVVGISTANAAASSDTPSMDEPASQWTVADYNRPGYDCEANTGKPRITYADLSRLQPCWNSSVHIQIDNGWPKVVGGSIAAGDIRLDIDLNNAYDIYEESDGSGKWDFTVLPRDYEGTYWFDFKYNEKAGNPILDAYVFFRTNSGRWSSDPNGDTTIPRSGRVDVVLVAVNNLLPTNIVAPVPFDWADAYVY